MLLNRKMFAAVGKTIIVTPARQITVYKHNKSRIC